MLMDPNANLKEQRELTQRIMRAFDEANSNGIDQEDANRLAELVQALDEWLVKGGFLPESWRTTRICI
jgi:hypothetical protein